MLENFWKDKYPSDVPSEINPDQFPNIQTVIHESCRRFADKPAFTCLGKTLTWGDVHHLSGAFAAYLQEHTDLKPGDRIAVQMPNILQYPVVVFGAIRAGLVIVNTNPLYTTREMEHQFNDSGAKALVCLANMAHLAEEVLPKTGVKHVIVTEVGDMLPLFKRLLVNYMVKNVKKMVPPYNLPQAVKFTKALSLGIRPEGVLVSREAQAGYVPLEAHIIEPLGSHDIVDLKVGQGILRARTPSGFVGRVGEIVHARIDPVQAHFFDTGSGQSLGVKL